MEQGFFKRNHFIILFVVLGCLFFTVTRRWDLYASPASQIGEKLSSFLALETFAFDGTPSEGTEVANAGGPGQPGQPGHAPGGEDPSQLPGEEIPGDGQGNLQPEGGEGDPADGQDVSENAQDGSESGFKTVELDYFDDALFIGDSRVVGLRDYGKFEDHGTFYAYEGLNIFRLLNQRIVEVPGQRRKITVEDALTQNQFAKIYIMVGINELDIGTKEGFIETYKERLARIQELQPDAKITIMSIMLVTDRRSRKGDFISNKKLIERNEALKELADGEKIFYLDVNEAITDESGGMNPAYTSDGIHLKAKYVPLWTEWLKTHVME
ncbi:MAG: hypothetical protein J5546_04060 [Lachnospiraceae bacterium]|nr:hypothetical protein [Lachnospiraceae bacterium]